jgi:hypothetical protein
MVSYANGNLASQKFVDKAVLDDKSVYPDAATMAKLYTVGARDQRAQRLRPPEARRVAPPQCWACRKCRLSA